MASGTNILRIDPELTETLSSIVRVGAGPANNGQPPAPARPLTDAEIQEGRRQHVEYIGSNPVVARWARAACAEDDSIADVAKERAEGKVVLPDAVDACLAALKRVATDRTYLTLYGDLADRATGEDTKIEDIRKLPAKLMAAVADGSNIVDLGDGRSFRMPSGLAFDVGYNAGYANHGKGLDGKVIDEAKLRATTENCLSQHGDNKICFATGFVQGAKGYEAAHQEAAVTAPLPSPRSVTSPTR